MSGEILGVGIARVIPEQMRIINTVTAIPQLIEEVYEIIEEANQSHDGDARLAATLITDMHLNSSLCDLFCRIGEYLWLLHPLGEEPAEDMVPGEMFLGLAEHSESAREYQEGHSEFCENPVHKDQERIATAHRNLLRNIAAFYRDNAEDFLALGLKEAVRAAQANSHAHDEDPSADDDD